MIGSATLALLSECRTGLALPVDRGKRSVGPAALGGFLDRGVDLAEPPIEVRDGMGCHLDAGGKGGVPFRWQM